jgi:hypothetical protein
MNNRQTEPATRLENPRDFPHGGGHRANIVKRHKGDREIHACVVEWKCGVGQTNINRRIEFASSINIPSSVA